MEALKTDRETDNMKRDNMESNNLDGYGSTEDKQILWEATKQRNGYYGKQQHTRYTVWKY